MSYTYLQDQGAESSADTFWDIPQYALSRLSLIAEKPYCSASATERSQDSQSGTMSQHSTAPRGEGELMSSVVDSHAKTSVSQGGGLGSLEIDQDCGPKWQGSFAKYDQNSSSWKTHQCLLFEDSTESLGTFPSWGIMQDGDVYPLQTPVFPTQGTECGFFPTPRASTYKNRRWWIRKEYHGNLEEQPMVEGFASLAGKCINPTWLEWMMGWVLGWADLKPLEMDRFLEWQRSHGVSCSPLSLTSTKQSKA